jgi:hypothetical protein
MDPISGLAPDSPSLSDLGGSVWPIDIKDVPMVFNPAIGRSADGKLAIVARKSNYKLNTKFGALQIPSGDRAVTNETYFSYLNKDFSPKEWRKVVFSDHPKLSRGVEDARLLSRGDRWFLNATMLEVHTPRARVCVYSLNPDMTASHLKTYDGSSPEKPEKNWMTKLESGTQDFEFVSDMPDNIRGGSSLIPWGDGYLALCHKTYTKKNTYYNPRTFGVHEGSERTYTHIFVEFSSSLKVLTKSKEFFLVDRGIEFGMGLVQVEEDLILSFGREDKESWFGKISVATVKNLLKEGA